MSMRLRDLIRLVRSCRTAADERAAIRKEMAEIRTAFKKEDDSYRHRNVAKLLYCHMLGYSTHFGQMECLKLIASPKFAEKRIGYLCLMVMLDEKQEVLMLVTNSVKNDLNHPNQFIVGLALASLGNIGSADMCRDLAPEVEKLLVHSNPYIRKKAALVTVHIIRKVPDLVENFLHRIRGLLSDRNHAVLLSAVTMIVEMCLVNPDRIGLMRRVVPNLIHILKTLVQSGYAPEHDVGGITDPFLQVKILKLLGILGNGDIEASDMVNDTLAQIATNTETTKNVGNAVLYECVHTIMSIESESGLRVLAINILGRFLLNRDNNIRYVALNTLAKVLRADTHAVARHRNTIVDCLKDPDVSIRRRALDLVYALVNESNVRVLIRELLNYLLVADQEFKPDLCHKICTVIERFAPDDAWRIDQFLRVLNLAGNYVREDQVATFLILILQNSALQSHAVRMMYRALKENMSQDVLVRVAVWCIGEFGELLTKIDTDQHNPTELDAMIVSDDDIISLLETVLRSNLSTESQGYTLTALIKLTTRLGASHADRIRNLIAPYAKNHELELQQRGVEYQALFGQDAIRPGLLERMPPLTEEQMKERDERQVQEDVEGSFAPSKRMTESNKDKAKREMKEAYAKSPSKPPKKEASPPPSPTTTSPSHASPLKTAPIHPTQTQPKPVVATPAMEENLIDFDFDLSLNAPVAPVTSSGDATADLLADLMGGAPLTNPTPLQPTPQHPLPMDPISAMLQPTPGTTLAPAGSSPAAESTEFTDFTSSPAPATPSSFAPFTVFEKNGLTATITLTKNPQNPAQTQIGLSFVNSNALPLTGFVFQAAVPKYLKMQMHPASSSVVPPQNATAPVTQKIQVQNEMHGQKPLLLRVKIHYDMGDQTINEQAQINNFPAGV